MAQENGNNGKKKMTGKSEKALRKLSSVNTEIENIGKNLNDVKERLVKIINKLKEIDYLNIETELTNNKKYEKQKCMIETLPKRIEFGFNHLKFYIDFTLTQENGASADIKGCMIYGANRSTCFTKCFFPKITDGKVTGEKCERVSRCDRLEDKPLIQFFIDRHGMIQSAGEFEDSWWIEKEDDLPELHFRTMELIWPKALEWTNENLLT